MNKAYDRHRLVTFGITAAMAVGVVIAAITTHVSPALAHAGQTTQCDNCHAYPPRSISITTSITSTTVAAGATFPVNITWAGGSSSTEINWPTTFTSVARNNTLFNPAPRIPYSGPNKSGSTSSTLTAPATAGTYIVRVYAATATSPWETAYQDISVTVTAAAPTDTAGPIANAVAATPNPTAGAASVSLTASVSDTTTGNSNVAGAEYFIDSIGANGAGAAMTGTFTSPTVSVSSTVGVSSLTVGTHTIYVHGRDAVNNWGAASSTTLSVSGASPPPTGGAVGPLASSVIVTPNPTAGAASVTLSASLSTAATSGLNCGGAAYFIDIVGPNGSGTPMTGTYSGTSGSVNAAVNTSSLAIGQHVAYVQGRDTGGNWGPLVSATFSVTAGAGPVDSSGPATGAVTVTPSPTNGFASVALSASVSDVATSGSNIAAAEYFVDTIGANGAGTAMSGIFSNPAVMVISPVNVSGLSAGNHTIYVHGRDAAGNWGTTASVVLNITTTPASTPPVAPTSLTASPVSSTQVNLSWVNSATNATGLTLQRATNSAFSAGLTSFALASTATSYSDTSATASTTYYYRAYASNSAGNSSMSNTATTTTPAGTTIDAASLYSTNCASCHGTSGAGRFSGTSVSSATNTITNGTSGMPAFGSTLTSAQISALANYVTGTTTSVPAAPSSLGATAASATQVNLSWVNNATNATSITLQRAINSAFSSGLTSFSLTSTSTSYSDPSVAASTTYYYRVYASNSAGNSSMSNTSTVTTPASGGTGSAPVTSGVAATPNPTNGATSIALTASVSDATTGGSNITAAEYFIDTVGAAGTGSAMTASDGAFSSVTEAVGATASMSGLALGNHTLYVRGRDASGNWGAASSVVLSVSTASSGAGPVTSSVAATPNPTGGASSVTLTASVSDVTTGGANVTAAEYFIDTIGTAGTGNAMTAANGSFNSPTEAVRAIVATSGLAMGNHTLYVHGRDAGGSWGAAASVVLAVSAAPASGPVTSSAAVTPNPTNGAASVTLTASVSDVTTGGSNIAGAEYFIDTVGATGTGNAMTASDGAFSGPTETVTATVSMSGLSRGNHTLYIRGRDAAGNWGAFTLVVVNINDN